jgi:hypothetical protein
MSTGPAAGTSDKAAVWVGTMSAAGAGKLSALSLATLLSRFNRRLARAVPEKLPASSAMKATLADGTGEETDLFEATKLPAEPVFRGLLFDAEFEKGLFTQLK